MENTAHSAPKALPAVAGHYNGIFARDSGAAMSAVIVNPLASHADRVAWALGQLALLQTVAEATEVDDPSASNPLACVVQQLLEQSMAVLRGVLDELERPRAQEVAQWPLRVV